MPRKTIIHFPKFVVEVFGNGEGALNIHRWDTPNYLRIHVGYDHSDLGPGEHGLHLHIRQPDPSWTLDYMLSDFYNRQEEWFACLPKPSNV